MISIFTDAGVRSNPSANNSWAIVIVEGKPPQERCLSKCSGRIKGRATNNQMEYYAILQALKYAKKENLDDFRVVSDSNLAICQITGKFKVKNPGLKEVYLEVVKIAGEFEHISFQWSARESTWIKKADEMCNKVMEDFLGDLG